MSDAILVALISGGISLISVAVSYKAAVDKVSHDMQIQQAITQRDLQTLKDDVKEHNHYARLFAESMPVVQKQIKVINHRIADLEREKNSPHIM